MLYLFFCALLRTHRSNLLLLMLPLNYCNCLLFQSISHWEKEPCCIWFTNIILGGRTLSCIILTKWDSPVFITNIAWWCAFCWMTMWRNYIYFSFLEIYSSLTDFWIWENSSRILPSEHLQSEILYYQCLAYSNCSINIYRLNRSFATINIMKRTSYKVYQLRLRYLLFLI